MRKKTHLVIYRNSPAPGELAGDTCDMIYVMPQTDLTRRRAYACKYKINPDPKS